MKQYIVECLFNNIVTEDGVIRTFVDALSWTFSDEDPESSLAAAKTHMATILLDGIRMAGDEVLLSIVPPHQVLQLGLIEDFDDTEDTPATPDNG